MPNHIPDPEPKFKLQNVGSIGNSNKILVLNTNELLDLGTKLLTK